MTLDVVEPLDAADIDRCTDLCVRVGWPVEPARWEMMFALGPGFGIAAAGGALSAMVVFPAHEGASFVAMMAVDPALQRRGLGRALLEGATPRVAQPLMLYASDEGRRLYERLGFRAVDSASKHVGTPTPTAPFPEARRTRVAERGDHARIVQRDARAFGVRRASLVAALLARAQRVVVDDRGGFAIRWDNGSAAVVGPIVADTEAAAIALCDGALDGAAGVVRVDVPEGSPGVAAYLRARGLVDTGPAPLMLRGFDARPGARETYHALALYAFG